MKKSYPSPRWHREGGFLARRVSLRDRCAWSFVVSLAMVSFLQAQGNAQSHCETPGCDCRTGQVTPCDAVASIGSRSFDSLMLPSLAEATLSNTDRLGNAIESATLKWMERSRQFSKRWRFSDSSCDRCDAGGHDSRACGSEHPPIANQETEEMGQEKSGSTPPPEWTELPMAPSASVATPPMPPHSSTPVWVDQRQGTPELPQPNNKQNPLIDPFIDDPHQPAPIIPSVQGKPLGTLLRKRDDNSATPSSAIDVPPVWIATRTAAGKRTAAAIDHVEKPSADTEIMPSDLIRQASDSQPIRDPAASTGSKTPAQAPRNKRRPKPFESSQRSQVPAVATPPIPPAATPPQPDTKPLPTNSMQSYEEFANRLQASRSGGRRATGSANQPLSESLSAASSATSEAKSGSTSEQAIAEPEPTALPSEPSVEAARNAAPLDATSTGVDPSEATELSAIAGEGASNLTSSETLVPEESTSLPGDATDASEDAGESGEEQSQRVDSDRPGEDAEAILDARITQRILTQLQIAKDQGALKQFELDVSTVAGEVWARGFVSRPEHKKLILDTIQQVPGVVVVIDDVSIARPMPAPMPPRAPEEAFGSQDIEKPGTHNSNSAASVAEAQRGLSLPKWLRPKAGGAEKENTDFRSTLQSSPSRGRSPDATTMTPRSRTRGTFGAPAGSGRAIGAAPLSNPVTPVKPTAPTPIDANSSGHNPIAGATEELPRRNASASGIPESRADIDRKTKARLAATATRVDQPITGTSGPSKLSLPTPPSASGESPAAATSQRTSESTSEQGLDLNSFLQRVNAAKQQKDR